MALYRGNVKVSGIGQSFNPENTGTEGQVLTKTNSGYAYQDIPQELPTTGNVGDVLTKTADGVAFSAPQGGGTPTLTLLHDGNNSWTNVDISGYEWFFIQSIPAGAQGMIDTKIVNKNLLKQQKNIVLHSGASSTMKFSTDTYSGDVVSMNLDYNVKLYGISF